MGVVINFMCVTYERNVNGNTCIESISISISKPWAPTREGAGTVAMESLKINLNRRGLAPLPDPLLFLLSDKMYQSAAQNKIRTIKCERRRAIVVSILAQQLYTQVSTHFAN